MLGALNDNPELQKQFKRFLPEDDEEDQELMRQRLSQIQGGESVVNDQLIEQLKSQSF